MIAAICSGVSFVVLASIVAGGVGLLGLVLWMFLVFPIVCVIQENIKADSFETWLEDQRSTSMLQEVGKFTLTKTTYQIPAGVALVKLIQLTNKKKLSAAELAFTTELIETINSIETLGYSVESID